MYDAHVLADSIGPSGVRLTTVQATFPRFILAELNTHKMLSKSSASSRAIPTAKRVKQVREAPFVPEFGRNQKGMQAGDPLEAELTAECKDAWRNAAYQAALAAEVCDRAGAHKQWANRPIEPYSWHTAIITGTDWNNFFGLRIHPKAQPEFQTIAKIIRAVMDNSTPQLLGGGEWHLPLVPDLEQLRTEFDTETIVNIAVGRCARVSYLTHEGKREPAADIQLATGTLQPDGHMAPFEHVAMAHDADTWRGLLDICEITFAQLCELNFPLHEAANIANKVLYSGNLRGWRQRRKMLPGEAVFGGGLP